MGWFWGHKAAGMSVKDYLQAEMSNTVIVDCSVIKLHTAYMAAHAKDKPEEVYALVYLIGFARSSYLNFGYKPMDETMGLYEAECPARILDLLTPTTDAESLAWRARCRDNIAKAAAAKSEAAKRPALEKGMVIVPKNNFVIQHRAIKSLWITAVRKHWLIADAHCAGGYIYPVRITLRKLGAYEIVKKETSI